ncbi:uncharacterized protein LOC134467064 [Engraulis encrasicolus]|uniref:uncharacterized protein LOC134467064 n=1 Tax=Engraulis encrasicolus TaxID=184585 RepID=UPI002FD57A95
MNQGKNLNDWEEVEGPKEQEDEGAKATLVDHVINHGMSYREAGERVQPNLSRYTVAGIIRTFHTENRTARNSRAGGRQRLFTPDQETNIVNMVMANNTIRLREIQQRVIEDDTVFANINTVSISALSRLLDRNRIRMKQVYRVPFERNSERVKQLRREYVQRVMALEADAMGHELIFVDEAGFNLTKTRRRGRNVIGQRAITDVPGQRGGNITMCAAISHNGVLHHHATLGPYNTNLMIRFLNQLNTILTVTMQPDCVRILNLPPYSPFLNAIEEFFSAWRWRFYERNPQQRMALLQAMEEACGDIDQAAFQGWIRHARRYFPRCLALEDIASCDVDEILWPDAARRRDVQ